MNIPKLKLVTFDWDGTLVDSIHHIVACKTFLAKKYKLAIPHASAVKHALGLPFNQALSLCFPNVKPSMLDKLSYDFHNMMQQKCYQGQLFTHAKKNLLALKKQHIKLAIATSKAKVELDKAIEYNKLSGLFDVICCSEEYAGKPDPMMLVYIMKKLAIQSSEHLMIGDTTTDILFAKHAKVNMIAVTFGAHSAEQLGAMCPYALMDNWNKFPQLIAKLC